MPTRADLTGRPWLLAACGQLVRTRRLHAKIHAMQLGRVAPVLVLVAGLVAGCTSDGAAQKSSPAPSSAPSSSVTASASTSPSPSLSPSVLTTGPNVRPGEKPPRLTANARTNSRAGASDFAFYWFQTLDWAYATTDGSLARQQFKSTCRQCNDFLQKAIDGVAAEKAHYSGGRLIATERSVESNDGHFGSSQVIDAAVAQGSLKVVASTGRVLKTAKAVKRGLFRTWLKWESGRWYVVDWRQGHL